MPYHSCGVQPNEEGQPCRSRTLRSRMTCCGWSQLLLVDAARWAALQHAAPFVVRLVEAAGGPLDLLDHPVMDLGSGNRDDGRVVSGMCRRDSAEKAGEPVGGLVAAVTGRALLRPALPPTMSNGLIEMCCSDCGRCSTCRAASVPPGSPSTRYWRGSERDRSCRRSSWLPGAAYVRSPPRTSLLGWPRWRKSRSFRTSGGSLAHGPPASCPRRSGVLPAGRGPLPVSGVTREMTCSGWVRPPTMRGRPSQRSRRRRPRAETA